MCEFESHSAHDFCFCYNFCGFGSNSKAIFFSSNSVQYQHYSYGKRDIDLLVSKINTTFAFRNRGVEQW